MDRESIYKRYKPAVTFNPRENNNAYWFVFCDNKLMILTGDNGVSIPFSSSLDEFKMQPVRIHYLGILEDHHCYAAEVSPGTIAPEGTSFRELRSTYGAVDEDIFLLAGRALQIVSWDQTHQFCGRCGHRTETLQGERAKKCPACGFMSFPRISPAVITAVLKDDKILLTHNAAFRGNFYSVIAGFVEPGETLEECVKREILEEVGIRVRNIKYFGSQPWPFPNSLMIGFTAEYESGEIAVDGKEISEAGWFGVNDMPVIPPNMSIARELIDWYIEHNLNLNKG